MLVSHVPLFDVGDEDVLFVKNNTKSACPLVGCADGRMRIIDSKMYDEEGYRIVAPKNLSTFTKGKCEASSIVDSHNIGNIPLRWEDSPEPKTATNAVSTASAVDQLPQVSSTVFADYLKSTVTSRSANATSMATAQPMVFSADFNQKLVVADSQPVAESQQPKVAPYATSTTGVSAIEKQEVEQRIKETEQNQSNGADKGIMPTF